MWSLKGQGGLNLLQSDLDAPAAMDKPPYVVPHGHVALGIDALVAVAVAELLEETTEGDVGLTVEVHAHHPGNRWGGFLES